MLEGKKEHVAGVGLFGSRQTRFPQKGKRSRFFYPLLFIGTDGPHINAARVVRRVMDGGHDVPITKIISRYNRSIANGAIAMAMVDRAYGYDNSVDDRDPKKLFRTKDGRVFKTYADLKLHEWGQMMIEELAKPARGAPGAE